MSDSYFAKHTHNHHVNDEGLDLGFIEAAHYEREAGCQPTSPAQQAIGYGVLHHTPNVEHYAPTEITVLALPTLYCMAHATEHPCAFVHVKQRDMGACDLAFVSDESKYEPAERVEVTAAQTYTGIIERV